MVDPAHDIKKRFINFNKWNRGVLASRSPHCLRSKVAVGAFWKNAGRPPYIPVLETSPGFVISGTSMIPKTEMKLREAKFFFVLLHQTGQQTVRNEPEAFAFYLNAFLSAARAVTFALQFEDKANYDTWFTPWRGARTEKERELLAFMVIQRKFRGEAR